MSPIEQVIEHYRRDTPDIAEHLDTLTNLASEVEHVTEMGFRYGASACALLKGNPKKLVSYDLQIPKACRELFQQIKGDTDVQLFENDTLNLSIAPTDLLFIDTLHTYKQLKEELQLHAEKAKKYIVFHDTMSYRHKGEDGTTPGLYDAIMEYIEDKPHWFVKFDHSNNNGLLCLERR